MADEQLKPLIQQGLAALQAGGKIAAAATEEIQDDARYPELRAALKQGNEQSKQWMVRIERAVQEAGDEGDQENPILEAHFKVSKKIRGNAPDDLSRDLGIIASGQLALHYWIASFGTLRTYAGQAGLHQTQREMQACLDEAKEADEQQTQIAEQIMRMAS